MLDGKDKNCISNQEKPGYLMERSFCVCCFVFAAVCRASSSWIVRGDTWNLFALRNLANGELISPVETLEGDLSRRVRKLDES